jgi:HK97 family phage portal protein
MTFNAQNVDGIFGYSSMSKSGVPVNENTALSNPTLLSGLRLISESVAMLPWRVMLEDDGGHKSPDKGHPIFGLLLNSPNESMSTFTFIATLVIHMYLYGRAYIWIHWNRQGDVRALELLYPPSTIEWGTSAADIHYTSWIRTAPMAAGELRSLMPYEVIKLNFIITQNFFLGHGLLELAEDPIGLALALDSFAASYFRNGAHMDGYFTSEKELTEDQKKRVKTSLAQEAIGVSNAFRQTYMPTGLTWHAISNNPQESQSVEQREFQVEEVARLLRIPSHMLGSRIKQVKTSESDSIDFLKYCILPVVRRIEQAMNGKLFLGSDRGRRYIEADFKELLRTDALIQRQALAIDRQNGVICANEWRAQIGLPPVDDPFLNEYLVLSNMGGIGYQGKADNIQGQLSDENIDEEENKD